MSVLALGSEHSFGPRIVALAQLVADDVRGGSIPAFGHWVAEENPAYLLAQLLDFLPKRSRPGRVAHVERLLPGDTLASFIDY